MDDLEQLVPFQVPDLGFGQETAATKAYYAIRRRILRCKLAPGSIINDRMLMEELALGRTPIREALLRLSAERLVFFSGQGIQVAPVTIESISDLYTARLHYERLAWQLWLRTVTPEQVACLAAVFDDAQKLVDAGDEEGLIDLDFRFHTQVYKECGNGFLTAHLYNLAGLSFRVWFLSNPHKMEHHVQTMRSHDPLIEAVKRRDAVGLDREVTDHITDAFHTVVQRLKGEGLAVAAELSMTILK